VFLTLAISSVS